MTDNFNELYGEFEAKNTQKMLMTKQAQLKPTPHTLEYLTFAYKELGRGDFLEYFLENKQHFNLPLHTWYDWLQSFTHSKVNIDYVYGYLKDETGVQSMSDSAIAIHGSIDKNEFLILFFGHDAIESLHEEYQEYGMESPVDELVYSIRGTQHLNMTLVEDVADEFALTILPLNLLEIANNFIGEIYFAQGEDWADFLPEDISNEAELDSHFIFIYY
ncbi:hypothetical protein HZY88_00055 [Aerococcaceae bacterium DSM 111176]|nr:hypothetical protein [Aerococcaceae bacterium DSM 111176]